MSDQTIIIRADATETIGTGHVMRCIALAQELRRRCSDIHFVMSPAPSTVISRLEKEGFTWEIIHGETGTHRDADMTCAIARRLSASWIILDGYKFGGDFQKAIKDHELGLLCIDDYGHADQYHADIILNQNIYAEDIIYPANDKTRLLLGSRYALLRKEILPWREDRCLNPGPAKKIVITMGGSDPQNATLLVLHALQKLPVHAFSARIVIGGSNPHAGIISESIRSTSHDVELLRDVSNIGEIFAWADLAITSGGSTTLELAYIGVPMITLVIADNQKRVCESLDRKKAAINMGIVDKTLEQKIIPIIQEVINSHDLRNVLSRNAQCLVDGKGAGRVAAALCGPGIILKKARPAECWTVFHWANEPSVRDASFSSNPILWDEHMQWYLEKITNPDTFYWIILTEDHVPAGQVRFDIENTDATISILIDPRFRGRNMGVDAMQISAKTIFAVTDVKRIHAYIKPSNTPSVKAFRKAGFVCMGTIPRGFENAYHMILARECRYEEFI